jgi:hypothetical protein
VSVKSRQALIVLVLVIDLLADHRSTAEREDEWELAAQLALTLALTLTLPISGQRLISKVSKSLK